MIDNTHTREDICHFLSCEGQPRSSAAPTRGKSSIPLSSGQLNDDGRHKMRYAPGVSCLDSWLS
jgi:hypothetical protein